MEVGTGFRAGGRWPGGGGWRGGGGGGMEDLFWMPVGHVLMRYVQMFTLRTFGICDIISLSLSLSLLSLSSLSLSLRKHTKGPKGSTRESRMSSLMSVSCIWLEKRITMQKKKAHSFLLA